MSLCPEQGPSSPCPAPPAWGFQAGVLETVLVLTACPLPTAPSCLQSLICRASVLLLPSLGRRAVAQSPGAQARGSCTPSLVPEATTDVLVLSWPFTGQGASPPVTGAASRGGPSAHLWPCPESSARPQPHASSLPKLRRFRGGPVSWLWGVRGAGPPPTPGCAIEGSDSNLPALVSPMLGHSMGLPGPQSNVGGRPPKYWGQAGGHPSCQRGWATCL